MNIYLPVAIARYAEVAKTDKIISKTAFYKKEDAENAIPEFVSRMETEGSSDGFFTYSSVVGHVIEIEVK